MDASVSLEAKAPEFGPIVLRQDGRNGGGHQHLRQHSSVEAAHAEAERLTRKENAVFAVYVPYFVVRPEVVPTVTERWITGAFMLLAADDEDKAFLADDPDGWDAQQAHPDGWDAQQAAKAKQFTQAVQQETRAILYNERTQKAIDARLDDTSAWAMEQCGTLTFVSAEARLAFLWDLYADRFGLVYEDKEGVKHRHLNATTAALLMYVASAMQEAQKNVEDMLRETCACGGAMRRVEHVESITMSGPALVCSRCQAKVFI